MPNSSVKAFPHLVRTAQENSYYCGPASVQMLLSYLNTSITQKEVVDSLNLESKVAMHGMTIHELGLFIKEFLPQFQFWYKFHSTIAELSTIVNEYQYPVGVEWQGIFDYPDEEISEDEDDDPGHLSVVTAIDTLKNFIQIADPDIHYAGTDRVFSVLQFEKRWWDINSLIDPITHKKIDIEDHHGLFIITHSNVTFPKELELEKV